MSDAVRIREARPGDGPALLGLIRALADYEKLEPPDEAARARLLHDLFGPSPRLFALVAESGDRLVGYALWLHTYSSFLARPTLYLEDLFVLPEERRGGVGRAFMQALARLAMRDGAGRMEWTVLRWNELALDFYARLGARRLDDWVTLRLDAEGIRAAGGPLPGGTK